MTANSKKIKALIVDDEPPARRNLRALLTGDSEIELVKECGNGLKKPIFGSAKYNIKILS